MYHFEGTSEDWSACPHAFGVSGRKPLGWGERGGKSTVRGMVWECSKLREQHEQGALWRRGKSLCFGSEY